MAFDGKILLWMYCFQKSFPPFKGFKEKYIGGLKACPGICRNARCEDIFLNKQRQMIMSASFRRSYIIQMHRFISIGIEIRPMLSL